MCSGGAAAATPACLDGYWNGGYVAAMGEIATVLKDELGRTSDDCRQVLKSVAAVVDTAREVYYLDSLPPEWLTEGDGR